ncbi:unnamed protein product [Trichobilharzia regenti]|uniref:G_PROTEIN_RECEP_F1_2 domain-containing protein n=1 Tax=Trichobilharzia regenti TaxID=157069 RepID=A0A183W8P2_TRIRE|nr:unnamed protein product [Trichobilharzia regenti]VDQ04376.1 unnamed protein product [Trichobilharzia regenti]
MSTAQSGVISMLKHGNSVADKIDVVALSVSFINAIINPLLIVYIFDINLGTHSLSILIMLQMTFEWLTSIAGILYIFIPVIKTNELWFNILICHMWSSTFMYNLFIMFCKYNSVTMLIERCFQIIYPNKNILDYSRTVFTSYCFALIYVMAINLRFTVMVQMNALGECTPVDQNLADDLHRKQLIIFSYLCLALLLILPGVIMATCYIIMFIQFVKRKRENKNYKGFDRNNLQHILTLLVIIWSVEAGIANILDMIVFYDYQNYGYTNLTQTTHSATELVRIFYYVTRTISLFIFIKPIRIRLIEDIYSVINFSSRLFKCKRKEIRMKSKSLEANY